VGIGRPVSDIVNIAYNWPPSRITFAGAEPTDRYDFVTTLPQGPLEALQQELKKRLGFVARKETKDTDVLLLKVRSRNAPGLKNPSGGDDSYMNYNGQMMRIKIDDRPLSVPGGPSHGAALTTFLELIFKMPVVDETGLTENYSINLQWTELTGQTPGHDALKQALLNQLGLELVPARQPVEMLVVEKTDGSQS
jgi:uncharacterized protein (TIGR03435 family)